ncbi:MAG: putative nucleic acid-binding protein [Candidatus Nitrosomirales archaeon]|jgi:predicted nucleic acid-binding protein
METYVVDTVALAKYLADDLPESAERIFLLAEKGKAKLLVPSIVVGEFIYSALKGRVKAANLHSTIVELLQALEVSEYLQTVDMSPSAWQEFLNIKLPELHDRMISAIAISNNVSIITNDPEIRAEGARRFGKP